MSLINTAMITGGVKLNNTSLTGYTPSLFNCYQVKLLLSQVERVLHYL